MPQTSPSRPRTSSQRPSRPRRDSRDYRDSRQEYDSDRERERERERRRRARESRESRGYNTDADRPRSYGERDKERRERSRGYHTDADRPRSRRDSRGQSHGRDYATDREGERERLRRERARRERERAREEEEERAYERPSERRKRRGHRAQDSEGGLLANMSPGAGAPNFSEEARRKERERQQRRAKQENERDRERRRRERERERELESEDDIGPSGKGGAVGTLNAEGLAKLDEMNQDRGWEMNGAAKQREWEKTEMKKEKKRQKQRAAELRGGEGSVVSSYYEKLKRKKEDRRRTREVAKEKRVVSGTHLEKGDSELSWGFLGMKRGGGDGTPSISTGEVEFRRKRRKRLIYCGIITLIILVIIIAVAVVVSKKNDSDSDDDDPADSESSPSNSNLKGISQSSIPKDKQGTYYDPFSWYDTVDFNVTYTDEKVGGLPIMGLNDTWNDDVQANDDVPSLTKTFDYGNTPIRGMNVGGWFSLEPFITPSFFEQFDEDVIDEWTLTSTLGSTRAAEMLEQHYSSFITKQDFADIRSAGFDHVRIPFSYWAVTTYEGDPYVPMISWRYLLRAIEYCRQNGLRVKLDLHGIPGSQNGWNHSGRQGPVGWLNGTDGTLNAQRSYHIHDQLSTFFTQDRYKNLVTMYGLCNEPRMVDLNTQAVIDWTEHAISIVRGNDYGGIIVFGDGFMGLPKWQGLLQGYDKLLLDVHQYVIFNTDLIVKPHAEKINFACSGFKQQMTQSLNLNTGFGPTMCGEWSQADTDCATDLNNVGVGSRWEGTMNTGNLTTSVLTPYCPTGNNPACSCDEANASPDDYSDIYKTWLTQFAEGQMDAFEYGWGWFYWTWKQRVQHNGATSSVSKQGFYQAM